MRECRELRDRRRIEGECGWLGLPPKLGGNVGLVDGLLVEFLEALGLDLFAFVLGEVSNVFGVDEVFFFGVCGGFV